MICPNCKCEVQDGMAFCTNCGTEIPQIPSSKNAQTTDMEKGSYPTTDTGTTDEKNILHFSELVWKVSLWIGILTIIIFIIVGLQDSYLFIMSILYSLLTLFTLFMVYVLRAFLRVIHNISINLHEINMKLK